ncbi:hypothetical protein CPC08DRAFT_822590 [Agrocybe pediades]|nr:hypothetical protein CPC08DRAFT_822590 [Agrocybe pediades]
MPWYRGAHGTPKFINFEQPAIITGGKFNQQNHFDNRHYTFRNGENAGYSSLLDNVAAAAMHDSRQDLDPPKCHPNTRVAIIQYAIDWTKGIADEQINQKSIIWLNGGAGAGKSAIARSVAERCSEQGLLLGSFFFAARDTSRNHVGGLVSTLCYQMCRILPGFRDMVSASIANDPLIFKSSISTQLITLLFDPFSRLILAGYPGASTTWIPRLIVIDGLDECSETMDQKNLLLALREATKSTTLIRFLICSRPEKHISSAFRLPQMSNIFFKIFIGDDYCASIDIRPYLEDKFKEIREGHLYKHTLPATWPAPKIIDDLVYKSSGQFIYASTVIRYIQSLDHKPHERLEVIFNLRPAFEDLPFAQLDALYQHIISKAKNLSKVLDILAFPLLLESFGADDIEIILRLQKGDVEVMLTELRSIVGVRIMFASECMRVWFLHKSVKDFLSDRQRAGELYRDLSVVQSQHIERVLSIVSTEEFLTPDFSRRTAIGFRLVFYYDCIDVSSILQSVRQFPMFKFIKELLFDDTNQDYRNWKFDFLGPYIDYLVKIKDASEEANLVYMEQMRQYCDSILTALENNFSASWLTHFFFTFWFLCPAVPQLSNYIPCWGLLDMAEQSTLCDDFPYTKYCYESFDGGLDFQRFIRGMYPLMCQYGLWHGCDSPEVIWRTVYKISYILTTGIKQKVIFSKSAAFCLAFLCDERSTSPHARHISRIMGIDQQKRRERPWRWRQTQSSSSRRSPQYRLAVSYCHHCWKSKLRRVGKAEKLLSQNRGCIHDWNQSANLVAAENRHTIRESYHTCWGLDGNSDELIFDQNGREREIVGFPPLGSILVWEVRATGDDVQEEILRFFVLIVAKAGQASTAGGGKVSAEGGPAGKHMNSVHSISNVVILFNSIFYNLNKLEAYKFGEDAASERKVLAS